MPTKKELLRKLTAKPAPTNFTMRELDALMRKCNCRKFSGGRGSGVGYIHDATGRIVQFDQPHPGNELYRYHIKIILQFLNNIGEV